MSKEIKDKYGITDVRGILLYGPPGTGKTLIARNIGSLIHNSVITKVNGPELSSQWFGETEANLEIEHSSIHGSIFNANIRKIFEDARKDPNKIHVIILDEVDAIGRRRSDNPRSHDDDKILTQLLTMIDGLDRRSAVDQSFALIS